METHKKISPPHYFFILFLLLVVQSLSYGNDTLQIDNPCPVGGVPVFEITGQIDINNPIKKIPVFTDQLCHSSIDSYHYNEHWLGWSEVGKLNFSISDSTLQISIYDAALYFSNDPCSGLLLEGQGYFKFELASTLHRNYIVIVVAGMIGQEYVINSDNVLRVYNEACIFDGTAKGEILSYNKIVMPDITVTAPDVKYVWDEMFGFQCNELDRLFRNQAISIMSPFQQLTIQSEYLFRKTKVETITWPKDVVLEDYTDCHNFTATPIEIYTQLKLKLGDSLARAMSFPFVNGSAIFGYNMSNYTFEYKDYQLKECSGKFITQIRREWIYKNKCNNTVNTYIQQISLKYEKPELIQLKDIRLSTDPWGCVATLRLDNNLAKVACGMDYELMTLTIGLTIYGNAKEGFTLYGFSAGTYKVQYFVMDCLGQRSDTLDFEMTVYPYSLSWPTDPLFSLTMEEDLVYIDSTLISTTIVNSSSNINHCYDYLIEIEEIPHNCDSVDNNQITLCCNDLLSQTGLPLLENYIPVLKSKIWWDINKDMVFQLPEDIYFIRQGEIKLSDKVKEKVCPNDTIINCLLADISPEKISNGQLIGQCFTHQMTSFKDLRRDAVGNHVIISRQISEKSFNPTYTCVQKIVLEDCTSSIFDVGSRDHNMVTWNQPNPFEQSTTIHIVLSESKAIDVLFFDYFGRAVFVQSIQGVVGENSISITDTDLGANGMYMYQIKSGSSTITKKMLLGR